MAGAQPGAVVTMEVFVEQDIIPPVGIVLQDALAASMGYEIVHHRMELYVRKRQTKERRRRKS